jgi:hypothetical protein
MRTSTHHPSTERSVARHPVAHHRRVVTAERGRRRERGLILPMTGLAMMAFLLVATLVIDGSAAYPQRRSMQNAADSASLAATRALDKVHWQGASPGSVVATAQSVAADNGAESSQCWIIDPYGNQLGTCTDGNAIAAGAGVEVRALDRRSTTFGPITGKSHLEVTASAAATVQTFAGGTAVPFIVCGNATVGGYDILDYDAVADKWSINVDRANALGKIELQAAQIRDCGTGGASFKGKLQDPGPIVLPGPVEGTPGNGFDSVISVEVAGARGCTTEEVASGGPLDCDILVPIAISGTGAGQHAVLYCVVWSVFHVTGDGHGNPKYWGEFVAAATYVTGGVTVHQTPPDASTPRVIRLIK